ncbi:MAG: PilZ domain-containing protein [Phycisphaerales bacterium JB039]
MSAHTDQYERQLDGAEALREACGRNAPIEVFRADAEAIDPPARGRLLQLRDDGIVIEKVQVIGRDIRFYAGVPIDAYFSYHGTIFHFRTKVIAAAGPVQLNRRTIVPGMTLARPARVEPGQRRSVYRVSLAGQPTQIEASIWRLDAPAENTDPAHDPALESPPNRTPDYIGTVVDASDTGLGLIVEGCPASRFRVYQRVFVQFHAPGDSEPIGFGCEIRHARELREDTTRLGVLFLLPPSRSLGDARVRRLVAYLAGVQRAQRRA